MEQDARPGAVPPPGSARSRIVERIRRFGTLSFADFMDIALYDPEGGFYVTGGGAGRRGDFLTSPEVGPLFAVVVGRALDAWWAELGRPDPFVVVEAGAGAGTLARDVIRSAPACAPALRYVLVERSATLRARQGERLSLEPPAWVLGPVGPNGAGWGWGPHPGEEDGVGAPAGPEGHGAGSRHLTGKGPLATSLAELPAERMTGVVVANELLDNLAFRLLERAESGWVEVRVAEADGRLAEALVPAAPHIAAEAERLAPAAPLGGRIPLQHQAVGWLRQALALVGRGRVVVVDYADTTPSLASRPWPDWLRTYRGHGPGVHPLADPGTQDITTEVALDQLARIRRPTAERSQAEFLRAHGLDELASRAREAWRERAHVGDLEAVRARSTVGEADALSDDAGLGRFRVLEWAVGRPEGVA